jgi:hypothetical protein
MEAYNHYRVLSMVPSLWQNSDTADSLYRFIQGRDFQPLSTRGTLNRAVRHSISFLGMILSLKNKYQECVLKNNS